MTVPVLLLSSVLLAQSGRFEVASIKASHDPRGSASGITTNPGSLLAANVTLRGCIHSAYNIPEARVFGGPKWIEQDRFYIQARSSDPAGDAELMTMLQALLAERFKLTLHRETRTLSGYELVVAKGGLKLKPSAHGTEGRTSASHGSLVAQNSTLAHLAMKLSDYLHTSVVDATNVPGAFDIGLTWTSTDEMSTKAAADSGPSLFTALQEQLGLKLQPHKVPTEVLVVDRAEKPDEN